MKKIKNSLALLLAIVLLISALPVSALADDSDSSDSTSTKVYSVTQGTLPDGLTVSSSGMLVGSPLVSGVFNFTVSATDEETGEVTTQSYTLNAVEDTEESTDSASDTDTDTDSMTLIGVENGEISNQSNAGSPVITIQTISLDEIDLSEYTIAADFRMGDEDNSSLSGTAQSSSAAASVSSAKKTSSSGTSNTTTNGSAAADDSGFLFEDVLSTDWFYENVKWAYGNGLMMGVNETVFAPENAISQATVLLVLARMRGVDLEEYADNPCSKLHCGFHQRLRRVAV